ncbi:SRPBCC family protein [Ornithinicoccus halotolerans]|uniref:SRPBCC family protein n=1 Tax=Ornithinicoccus halotolerans TaxID=1748220 RepID=UPI0012971017|nr:SRPBCC family protein [Ornithinicoccus halotolerans]
MAERTTSCVTVAAAPGAVLAVIADVEQYPQWASEVREVEVLSTEGDGWPDRVRFRLDAGVVKDSYVLDYDWDVTEEGTGVVSWELVEARTLKEMTGSYTLSADEGQTQVTYELTVDVVVPMLGMVKRRAERMIIDTALTNLRRRVETDG